MIDLHSHILPGLDDGPEKMAGAVAIAREAVANGTTSVVATPHVRDDFPTTARAIRKARKRLRKALTEAGIELQVLKGAEIAYDRLDRLGAEELEQLTLGDSRRLLIEMPFFGWPLGAVDTVRDLADAGYSTLLAHPERNSAVQQHPARLTELVEAGALVQVTAASLTGGFGRAASQTAHALIRDGLVHVVASDTHRANGRRSQLRPALASVDPALARWLAVEVPAAILGDAPLPPRPARVGRGARRGPLGLFRRAG